MTSGTRSCATQTGRPRDPSDNCLTGSQATAPSSPTLVYLTTQGRPVLCLKVPPESLPVFDATGFARIEMTDDQVASFVITAIDYLLARRRLAAPRAGEGRE
jgi:hypothetical protein